MIGAILITLSPKDLTLSSSFPRRALGVQRTPRKAVDSPPMVDMACWDSLERVFHEKFKYEIGIFILCHQYGSAYMQNWIGKG